MSTKSGGAAVKGSLKPDQRADHEGTYHSADDYQVLVSHRNAPFVTAYIIFLTSIR